MKILSLPVDEGGCGWYRIRQPLTMLKLTTDHELHVVDASKDNEMDIYEAMKVADVIVIRQGGEKGMRQIKEKYPEVKGRWVLDIDDNIELISPYSEHYNEYGVNEFYDNNLKQWIWKDKQTLDLSKNRLRVASLLKGMGEVDLVTTTTQELARYARQYSQNVKVLPNCIDIDRWWKLDMKPNKKLRVGWSGGVSHYEDFFSIKRPLNKLLKEFDFTLVMVGAHFEGVIDKENRDKVEVHDWLPFKGHSYRMMCLNLDVAIIPLVNLPFNRFKSSVKWYEMSAMGVPSVVSDILPYSEDTKDQATAMVYKTPKQFEKALKKLLKSPSLRKKIGYGARKWVEKNRDAKKCASMWIDAYK